MKYILMVLCVFVLGQNLYAQENFSTADKDDWLVSLPIAKLRARQSNKMVLMVWEAASKYPLPVVVKNVQGKFSYVDNLFAAPQLIKLLEEYFVLVKVKDEVYAHLLDEIEGKRKQSYIDKFNDDTLKVMDANGNILGTSGAYTEVLNLSKFIVKYALETSYIQQEIINYQKSKDFYSAFYLASKYVDYSLLVSDKVRDQILELSDLYFDEARTLLTQSNLSDKNSLSQRLVLTELKQDLINDRPRRVLRLLRKLDEPIEKVNTPLVAFLNYTAYRLQNDTEEFKKLESEISLLNLRQAQMIVNINRN